MSRAKKLGFDTSQFKITRGAMILLFAQLGVSLVWLMLEPAQKGNVARWILASPSNVWRDGKVWTLVVGPLLEPQFVSLCLSTFMLWTFLPTLERFWGTARFLRFAVMTTIVGAAAGTAMGLVTEREVPITGLDSVIYAGIVAYGVIYARQPVQFFGRLPMTGRQLMFGILAFLGLFIVLQGAWEDGAAYVASIGFTLLLLDKKHSPELWWQRWRRRRARRHLEVVQGGRGRPGPGEGKRDEPPRWIN